MTGKQKLKQGAMKGGQSKSPRKRLAARKNLLKANEGKKLARKIALLDHQIANNRFMRDQLCLDSSPKIIKALDSELRRLLDERNLFEQAKLKM